MKQDNQKQAFLLAYIAGLFDGEGWISLMKRKPRRLIQKSPEYWITMGLGNTNKDVVYLMKRQFGGNIREESVPNRRKMYRWYAYNRFSTSIVLKQLLPFLIIKKEKALLAISLYEDDIREQWKCVECGEQDTDKIKGYGFCENCYMRRYRNGGLKGLKRSNQISDLELDRRENLYQKMKRLNATVKQLQRLNRGAHE